MLSGNIPAISARDILLIDADRLDEIQVMMQHLCKRPPLQTQHTYSTPASSADGTRPARLMGKPLGQRPIICILMGSLGPRAELALLQITYPTQQLFCRWVMSANGSLFVRLKAVNICTDHLLLLISLNSSVSCTVVEVQTVGVAIAS